MLRVVRGFLLFCAIASPALAQDHEHHAAPAPSSSTSPEWTLATDANVFAGFNYQLRRYFDFAAWESQNWVMGSAARTSGNSRITLQGMVTFEPLTLGRYVYRVDDGSRVTAGGSPQLFQTGESFQGRPVSEYQHPHDLIMGLGVTYERRLDRLAYFIGADLVGSPTLGPVAFMHRESARDNPQVPLSHHLLDSTHSTPGVVRGGVRVSDWSLEASAFRGAEPDEDRYDLNQPRLDSWASRLAWQRGRWYAQLSGGRLRQPEWFAPFDQTRLTASLSYSGTLKARPLQVTAAWGHSVEEKGDRPVSRAGLLEWDLHTTRTLTTYGRAEAVRKEVVGLHVHTPDMAAHPTYLSNVGALTLGAVQDLTWLGLDRLGRVGIGGDMTFYAMSADLQPLYSGSKSFHVFFRWRPQVSAGQHVH